MNGAPSTSTSALSLVEERLPLVTVTLYEPDLSVVTFTKDKVLLLGAPRLTPSFLQL
jgi:hypothetical protein